MQNQPKIIFNKLKKNDKPKDPQVLVPKTKTVSITACECRKANGFAFGWCGVAGGGVPACDH